MNNEFAEVVHKYAQIRANVDNYPTEPDFFVATALSAIIRTQALQRVMWIPVFLTYFLLLPSIFASDNDIDDVPRIGQSYGTVLVSTLDGQLRALSTEDGATKWTLQDDPVLRAPTTVKQGFTFLPNPQDGSLYILKEGILKRLPLSIPALVHASPLKSSDGVLYAGSKRDVWLEIDPLTGTKVETLSATNDKVCPANNKDGVFVGRTEYRISMYDTKDRGKTWNTTFSDYTAHLLPSNNDYPFRHYVTSNGNVLTVGPTGEIIWQRDFGLPVVAMYLLQHDGLHKLHFTVMGGETMENIIKISFGAYKAETSLNMRYVRKLSCGSCSP
ncbi:hypothetical protein RB195_020972 [Necator americanus]|uniref:PQQ enzyme repeat protein n=1 Tax=Necator americanus TaxID=51031 RepID=A0ABR1CLI5_NECAM